MFIPISRRGPLPVQTPVGRPNATTTPSINGVQLSLVLQLFAGLDLSPVVALLNSLIATAT
jgi:hypothetical protein